MLMDRVATHLWSPKTDVEILTKKQPDEKPLVLLQA